MPFALEVAIFHNLLSLGSRVLQYIVSWLTLFLGLLSFLLLLYSIVFTIIHILFIFAAVNLFTLLDWQPEVQSEPLVALNLMHLGVVG